MLSQQQPRRGMVSSLLAVVLLVASCLAAVARAHAGPHALTNDSVSLLSKGNWFVKFHSPSCGHCKRLEPIWPQLVAPAAAHSVNIASIDCSAHSLACEKYGIRGYPTMKFFMNGEEVDTYQGQRTVEAFSEYVASLSAPLISMLPTTGDEIKKTLQSDTSKPVSFIRWVPDESVPFGAVPFVAASKKLVFRSRFFDATGPESLAHLLDLAKVSGQRPPPADGAALLFMWRDGKLSLFPQDLTSLEQDSAVLDFIIRHRYPPLINLDARSGADLVGDSDVPLLIAFTSPTYPFHYSLLDGLRQVARASEAAGVPLHFTWMSSDTWSPYASRNFKLPIRPVPAEELRPGSGSSPTYPSVVFINPPEQTFTALPLLDLLAEQGPLNQVVDPEHAARIVAAVSASLTQFVADTQAEKLPAAWIGGWVVAIPRLIAKRFEFAFNWAVAHPILVASMFIGVIMSFVYCIIKIAPSDDYDSYNEAPRVLQPGGRPTGRVAAAPAAPAASASSKKSAKQD
ncbi:hypothetical protein H696_06048 [Fonticula alba]|uniref:Thioredoxin domain-containing protein n=1 Tax=Fonticula alba TaxID=691883 RepID=A0A058YZX9_FONAL|nr:hypothetical protein H696_06048 [Fonticula alba]KCV67530.1 hypothetical protein H696_06048 [Fonticula alba]|eukprot:XP_009498091.1 hypothetical protein H696_06048 [Fonticula alba]